MRSLQPRRDAAASHKHPSMKHRALAFELLDHCSGGPFEVTSGQQVEQRSAQDRQYQSSLRPALAEAGETATRLVCGLSDDGVYHTYRRTRAVWTASGACTSGSTAHH
jgi:hypothetical protein